MMPEIDLHQYDNVIRVKIDFKDTYNMMLRSGVYRGGIRACALIWSDQISHGHGRGKVRHENWMSPFVISFIHHCMLSHDILG